MDYENNSFSFDRILHFPNKKPFYLKSKIVPIKGKKVIEYMGFGFGLCMNYKYEDTHYRTTLLTLLQYKFEQL